MRPRAHAIHAGHCCAWSPAHATSLPPYHAALETLYDEGVVGGTWVWGVGAGARPACMGEWVHSASTTSNGLHGLCCCSRPPLLIMLLESRCAWAPVHAAASALHLSCCSRAAVHGLRCMLLLPPSTSHAARESLCMGSGACCCFRPPPLMLLESRCAMGHAHALWVWGGGTRGHGLHAWANGCRGEWVRGRMGALRLHHL